MHGHILLSTSMRIFLIFLAFLLLLCVVCSCLSVPDVSVDTCARVHGWRLKASSVKSVPSCLYKDSKHLRTLFQACMARTFTCLAISWTLELALSGVQWHHSLLQGTKYSTNADKFTGSELKSNQKENQHKSRPARLPSTPLVSLSHQTAQRSAPIVFLDFMYIIYKWHMA